MRAVCRILVVIGASLVVAPEFSASAPPNVLLISDDPAHHAEGIRLRRLLAAWWPPEVPRTP